MSNGACNSLYKEASFHANKLWMGSTAFLDDKEASFHANKLWVGSTAFFDALLGRKRKAAAVVRDSLNSMRTKNVSANMYE